MSQTTKIKKTRSGKDEKGNEYKEIEEKTVIIDISAQVPNEYVATGDKKLHIKVALKDTIVNVMRGETISIMYGNDTVHSIKLPKNQLQGKIYERNLRDFIDLEVSTTRLNLYKEKNLKSAPVKVLKMGDKLTYKRYRSDGWLYVAAKSGNDTGWVKFDSVR